MNPYATNIQNEITNATCIEQLDILHEKLANDEHLNKDEKKSLMKYNLRRSYELLKAAKNITPNEREMIAENIYKRTLQSISMDNYIADKNKTDIQNEITNATCIEQLDNNREKIIYDEHLNKKDKENLMACNLDKSYTFLKTADNTEEDVKNILKEKLFKYELKRANTNEKLDNFYQAINSNLQANQEQKNYFIQSIFQKSLELTNDLTRIDILSIEIATNDNLSMDSKSQLTEECFARSIQLANTSDILNLLYKSATTNNLLKENSKICLITEIFESLIYKTNLENIEQKINDDKILSQETKDNLLQMLAKANMLAQASPATNLVLQAAQASLGNHANLQL